MKPARLAILAVAVGAGGLAMMLSGGSPPAPVAQAPAAPREGLRTAEVLTVRREVPMGGVVAAADLVWQAWPESSAGNGMIRKDVVPGAAEELAGSIARTAFIGGEPVRREKLIKANGSGFMAAILPEGKRALAITIDTRGANSAGGFVLPNDRVDVVRTYRDDEATKAAGADVYVSETVLQSIRVLAIGQNVQEKNGEKVVVGETATLELDPRQVEVIALAGRVGQLSLALRAMVDGAKPPEAVAGGGGLTVVRYGVPTAVGKK